MNKNDEIILEITSTSTEGFGVGKHGGIAVFVPNTAEGDVALIKILKVKKTYCYGKLLELKTPSPSRTEPDCATFLQCGGCAYRHITYTKECQIKSQKVYDCIKRIGGIDLPPEPIISANNILGYRNKAQLPFAQNHNTGFYALHSHRIVETENCLLSPQVFNEIAATTSRWAKKYNISVYNEAANTGLLRHLYLRIAKATNEIMVVLVINGSDIPFKEELLCELKKFTALKSIGLNINKMQTNVILGNTCKTLYGQDYITDILCGVKIRISALSFYQVNRDMTELLYKKAAEYAEPKNKNILDLYCGAGTIGLSMADAAKSVTGVEIIPEAINDAKINAQENGLTNTTFICADATVAANDLNNQNYKADVVILDPPRKGCEEQLIKTVATGFAPKKVVYISCDPATLARDAKLFDSLGYKLVKYTPVDLFPRTHHIETVALFKKV
ncbi:MAG: 23S rRNA (uracil(1939)-C(5))-methyltransferase RlmD [Clostridia bacterium]|nr:23S rRNA (uracil(1939)-C(5))-methyltransferase RlmD [Clostridia bacterium]